jgi:hypothetical protein
LWYGGAAHCWPSDTTGRRLWGFSRGSSEARS